MALSIKLYLTYKHILSNDQFSAIAFQEFDFLMASLRYLRQSVQFLSMIYRGFHLRYFYGTYHCVLYIMWHQVNFMIGQWSAFSAAENGKVQPEAAEDSLVVWQKMPEWRCGSSIIRLKLNEKSHAKNQSQRETWTKKRRSIYRA